MIRIAAAAAVVVAALGGCTKADGPNFMAPVVRAVFPSVPDYTGCFNRGPEFVWDNRTNRCVELSPTDMAQQQREDQRALQRLSQKQWAGADPDASACASQLGAMGMTQSYSGQSYELCLSHGTGPFWAYDRTPNPMGRPR